MQMAFKRRVRESFLPQNFPRYTVIFGNTLARITSLTPEVPVFSVYILHARAGIIETSV